MLLRTGPRRLAVAVTALAGLSVLVACSGSDEPAATTTTTASAPVLDDATKLNEIQVIGTHNSFHVAGSETELAKLAELDSQAAAERTYSHLPIGDQLETQQVRQLEFDIYTDPEGGLYSTPAFGDGDALDPAMDEPGTKVLHEQDVDYRSVCVTLVACLADVEAWSSANPDHIPVAINLQFKDGQLIFDVAGQAIPEKWTAEAMAGLDDEILSVFDRSQIITPDDVRGDFATLEEAVLAKNWPTLGDSRGKVMFLMINPEPYRSLYLEAHPDLEGAVMFTNAEPGQPDASYVGIDDPTEEGQRIAELVGLGYMVRTRADTPDVQGRTGDRGRLKAALVSGAQWISTDYPGPDGAKVQYGTDYVAELPGFAVARCNPVNAPAACDDAGLEP